MDNKFAKATERILSLVAQLKEIGWDFSDNLNNSTVDLPGNIGEANGASRQVFWDYDHDDFVLKVGLDPGDEKYCQKEVEVYNAAVEAGLGDYFGWTARIGEVDGVGIYAMEWLNCDEEEVSDGSYKHYFHEFCEENGLDMDDVDAQEIFDEEFNENYDSYCSNSGIREWFISSIPDWQMADELNIFLEEHHINDLHSANVGYRGTKLVLADYAGWGW